MGTKLRIPARRISENGRERFQIAMSAREWMDYKQAGLKVEVTPYDYTNTNPETAGEQRSVSVNDREKYDERVEEIAQYIRHGFPTESTCDFSTTPKISTIEFDPLNSKESRFGYIVWDSSNPFICTDGFHRWGGFTTVAYERYTEDGNLDFYITAFLAVRKPIDRILAFVVNNALAKKQSGNLLSWQKSELKANLGDSFKYLPKTIRKNTNYIVPARMTVQLINDGITTNNMLFGKITMPNTNYNEDLHHLSCNGLLELIMPAFSNKTTFLREDNFDPDNRKAYQQTATNIAKTVVNYFNAWHELIPAAAADKSATGYGLFKAHSGSTALVLLLRMMMREIHELRRTVPTQKTFVKLLKKLGNQYDAEYWKVANENGYNSTGGLHGKSAANRLAKRMMAKIKHSLNINTAD